MKKRTARILSITLAMIISMLVSSLGSFAEDCSAIRGKVLRLHVLANSDSAEDQALKLKVRDRILSESGQLFSNSPDKQLAVEAAREHTELLENQAVSEIRQNGRDYPAKAEVVNMYFTTREYEGFMLPAGYYDALRITIGAGKGKNWWCMIFPPLCVSAATDKKVLSDVLTVKEADIVNGKKYKMKFKAVEIIEKIKSILK